MLSSIFRLFYLLLVVQLFLACNPTKRITTTEDLKQGAVFLSPASTWQDNPIVYQWVQNDFTAEQRDKFTSDIQANPTLDTFFAQGNIVELRAWEVMENLDTLIRRDPTAITNIKDYFVKYPETTKTVKTEIEIAQNPYQYIDYLAHVDTDFAHFYYTFRTYGYLKNKRTWQWYYNNLTTNPKFGIGLTGYETKTYDEILADLIKQPQYEQMNLSDAFMVFAYTTNYYYGTVNRWIRSEKDSDLKDMIVQGATQSLAKVPTYPDHTTYWRGIKLKDEALEKFLVKYAEGQVVTDYTFQSIAPNKEDSFIGRPNYNIEMEIKGKKGTGCHNIHDFAWGKYEKMFLTKSEGVFLPGSQFLIQSVTKTGETYQLVLIEQ